MSEKMNQSIMKSEKQHKSWLLKLRIGEMFYNYGWRGFMPFAEGIIMSAVNLILHGFLLMILIAVTLYQIPMSLLLYAAIHGLFLLVGTIMKKVFSKKLDTLQENIRQLQAEHYTEECTRRGICNGMVAYDDGITVGNGSVAAKMRSDIGQLRIYQLSDRNEGKAFTDYTAGLPKGQYTVNDHIASLEFKRKFGIHLQGCDEKEFLRYLSPSVQVKMIRSQELSKYRDLHTDSMALYATIPEKLPEPQLADAYTWKGFQKYFKEAEDFCIKLRAMADRAHTDFVQMDFLRG